MRKIVRLFGTATLLSAIVLAGCAQPDSAQQTTQQPAEQQTSVEADTSAILRVNLKTEPISLDPPKAYDPVAYEVLNNTLEGLVRLDENHVPQPAIATGWDISTDGKTYIFYLRNDSYWSNGEPVTAHDFEYSWKRMVDPQNGFPAAFMAFPIAGAEEFNAGQGTIDDVQVKALDEYTLEVKLKAPTGYFISLISSQAFLPINKKMAEANPNWAAEAETILSNGPFKLTEWVHDQSIKAVKNEHFWDKERVKLAGIEWKMVNDEHTQFQMFQSGELDSIETLPNDVKKQLLDSGEAKYLPESFTQFIRFNTAAEPFHNANIRKAFALAVDRQVIIDNVLQGKQIPAMGMVPYGYTEPNGKDFRDIGGALFKDNDVALAQELLKKGMQEEGYTTLPPITLTYYSDDTARLMVQILQEMFKQNLGVDIHLDSREWKVFWDEQRQLKHQFSFSIFYADYPDAQNFLEIYQTGNPSNRTNFSNQAYDELIQRLSVEVDNQKRFDLLHEAEAMLMEEMPILPLFYGTKVYMEQPYVRNILRHPSSIIDFTYAEIVK